MTTAMTHDKITTATAFEDAKRIINNLELPYLQELATFLNAHVQKRMVEKKTWAKEEIARIAQSVGMTAADLNSLGNSKLPKAPKPERAPVPVKYRDNLDPTQTWTGRGRKPRWLEVHLKAGRVIREFEVSTPGA